jgi:hypothetical protein
MYSQATFVYGINLNTSNFNKFNIEDNYYDSYEGLIENYYCEGAELENQFFIGVVLFDLIEGDIESISPLNITPTNNHKIEFQNKLNEILNNNIDEEFKKILQTIEPDIFVVWQTS